MSILTVWTTAVHKELYNYVVNTGIQRCVDSQTSKAGLIIDVLVATIMLQDTENYLESSPRTNTDDVMS